MTHSAALPLPRDDAPLSRFAILLMAVACGTMVANLYYAQTLIDVIGPEIGMSAGVAGLITTLTQLGYGLGIILVVPLADLFENRRIVLISAVATVLGCIAIALSNGPATFLLSAGVIALVAVALLIACPQRRPKGGMHYGEVLSSTFSQLGKYRVVRMRAFYQASMFAAFNLFWTAAPLSLIHDFGLGHNGIGAFALAGAGGALVAPVAGWLADRRLTGPASLGALIALSIGFLLADWTVAAGSLIGFTIMAVLIDAAVQVSQITGQKLIFSLDPHARGRINAAYMTVMFVVGALGSVIGSTTYEAGGWSLSAIAGAAIGGVAALVFILFDRGASATR